MIDMKTENEQRTWDILSLGAGVQSSTLALMAARGEVPGFPKLDCAIFADTQDEPASVYRWLEWLIFEIAPLLKEARKIAMAKRGE